MAKESWKSFGKELKTLLGRHPKSRRSIYLTLLIAGGISLLYLIYSLAFLGRIYPGVYIGDVSFAGLKPAQAQVRIEQLLKDTPLQPLTMVYQDKSESISPADVEWQIDPSATAQNLYTYGRAGGFWSGIYFQLKAPIVHQPMLLSSSHSEELIEQKITEIAEIIDQPAVNATASYAGSELTVTHEQVGKRLNHAEIGDEITKRWGSFNGGTIEITLRLDSPSVVLGSVDELKSQAEKLSQAKLTLTWDGGKKTLVVNDIRQLIGFVGASTVNSSENTQQQPLVAQFTKERVSAYLIELAKSIDQPAKDPKLAIQDGKLIITQASQGGRVVDIDASAAAIVQDLTTTGTGSVALAVKPQSPIVDEKNLASLGIKERIGYGETNMRNSPANRRSNIANGVSLLSSALIKPGEEFSTVTKLGAVDNTTGFLPELVIKDNRTVPEFGGGLCQVSTTLFRSVLNAGLKVTERQNHSYRVSYYEPPIGLDATIYLPKPDLKFLNDTPAYILLQAKVVGNKVIFELWGTSDGRTSSVSDPTVTNLIDPPPPIYVDSDTLPLGETKITDHAHQGATAVAYYTVTRAGTVINKQTFKSVYKALPERGLHGTNASLPPTVPAP